MGKIMKEVVLNKSTTIDINEINLNYNLLYIATCNRRIYKLHEVQKNMYAFIPLCQQIGSFSCEHESVKLAIANVINLGGKVYAFSGLAEFASQILKWEGAE